MAFDAITAGQAMALRASLLSKATVAISIISVFDADRSGLCQRLQALVLVVL